MLHTSNSCLYLQILYPLYTAHLLKIKKPHIVGYEVLGFKKGGDLLSHINAVPSAQLGLTSLFGMGRGEPQCYNHPKLLVISLEY